MKKIMIPNGFVLFPGTYSDLLSTIARYNGTLKNDTEFHCDIAFPPKNNDGVSFWIVRGRLSFTFRCKILQIADFCKIQYHVYPNFVSALLLIVPVIYMIYSTTFSSVGDVIGYLFAEGIIIFIFLLERYLCIRQFVRKFSGED